jgi:hypothetical protein
MIGFIGTSLHLQLIITVHILNSFRMSCEENLKNLSLISDCWPNLNFYSSQIQVKVKVTLRLTVSQSVSLDVEPHLRLMTRYLLLLTIMVLFFVGRPLWREDGSVFCACCWSLSAQSFLGPSLLILGTIFYCLRFETSLFVASYDSHSSSSRIQVVMLYGLRRPVYVPIPPLLPMLCPSCPTGEGD